MIADLAVINAHPFLPHYAPKLNESLIIDICRRNPPEQIKIEAEALVFHRDICHKVATLALSKWRQCQSREFQNRLIAEA